MGSYRTTTRRTSNPTLPPLPLHPSSLPRSETPFDLRVKRYFPHVKDFERDEKGDVIPNSLKGPEKIEVRGGGDANARASRVVLGGGVTRGACERGRTLLPPALESAVPHPPPALAHPTPTPTHPRGSQARQQLSRERIIAGSELKVLHEQLKFCYHKEGVNHYVGCKELVDAIVAKSKAPYWGALGAPSREW